MVTNGNANAVPFIRNSNLFRKRIMDSLVCWYDIGKQQCTNESMASNPTLRDLSGNGHDMKCYNFAWTENSGINTTTYPNALVSDGVDDYAEVKGLPLLTKDKGYTFVAKRKRLSNIGTFLSKNIINNNQIGAFIAEYSTVGTDLFIQNFGANTIPGEFVKEDVIWQNSKSYNGTALAVGEFSDSDTLFIFSRVKNAFTASYALYSILIFDRDLTAEEIEWVKHNLIKGDNE